MKPFPDSARPVWRPLICGTVLQLALVLGVAMFAAGCGKKESPAPAATAATTPDAAQPTNQLATQVATTPPAAPATPRPAPVNLTATANGDGDLSALQQLNRAVIGFRMQHQRNPSSVEEAAAAAGIQLPPPPPGKKYAFNNRGLVALVDSSTK